MTEASLTLPMLSYWDSLIISKKMQCSLLARYLCVYSLQKSRLTVAVQLAQSFLAAQVKLKFSHPHEEKLGLYFLGLGKEHGMGEHSRARLLLLLLLGGRR